MKKTIIIIIIAILSATLIEFVWFGIGRTPNAILRRTVKSEFGINIKDINPFIDHFEDEWSPNGDGSCCIEFHYDDGNYATFFKQFDLQSNKEDIPKFRYVSKYFAGMQEGYYLYASTPDTFYILIIDPNNHKGVLYYDVM